MAGVTSWVSLEVVLVLRLGLPERTGPRELGDDLARPQPGGVDVGDGVLGHLALLVARVEDGGAIAGADVVALPVPRRRVVDLEEELEEVAEAQLVGIEDDLDGLGVRAVVAIGGIGDVAAAVADPGRDHTGPLADEVLHAPEAASGEDGGLGLVGHCGAPSVAVPSSTPRSREEFPASSKLPPPNADSGADPLRPSRLAEGFGEAGVVELS